MDYFSESEYSMGVPSRTERLLGALIIAGAAALYLYELIFGD